MRALNKIDKEYVDFIFGVCNKFIRKLTYYFFVILNLGTASFGKGCLFTQLNENAPLVEHFGPMYIYFDEYLPYSGGIRKTETNVNDNIQCDHVYVYYSIKYKMCTWVNKQIWEMTNDYFPG